MEIDDTGRLASLRLDDAMLEAAAGTAEETDGLINLPLSVKAIQATVFFKEAEHGQWRVSLRSKGDIDVGRVARAFAGGGHKNASGCTLTGALDDVKARIFKQLAPEVAVRPVPAGLGKPGS
jgi:phosphoesterase RecJ-like protein